MGSVHAKARSAASVAIAALMLATGLAAAPSASAAALDGYNLVTAAEVDQASQAGGWVAKPFRKQHGFDCGSYGVMTTFRQQLVRRGYVADGPTSAVEAVVTFANKAQAKAAHTRTLQTIRSCARTGPDTRLVTDEQQAVPGRARLLQLFIAPECCGHDTHSFIVVQRKRRVALLVIGELGVTPPGPLRGLATTVADRITR